MTLTAPSPQTKTQTKTKTKTEALPLLTAVTYQRVSTKEQASKGGRDEGFSIPAQREANAHKAESLGARVVAEFVDAGESARSADRPDLQRMLEYIATSASCTRSTVSPVTASMTWRSTADSCRPGSRWYRRPRTSTKPPQGCCCTASCRASRSSTPRTSPPRSPKA